MRTYTEKEINDFLNKNVKDLEQKIEEKIKDLSNLISRDGAKYIIAKEYGIDEVIKCIN